MSTLLIALGLLLLMYFMYNFVHSYSEITYVVSDVDGKTYMIRRGHNKSPKFLQDSANTLARINSKVEQLIVHLDENFSSDPTKTYFITKLKSAYSPYMISEAEVDPRYTTYTVDKEEMHICLRTRDKTENIYELNTLMYVVLHELSHLCNYTPDGYPIQGHGEEFKMIFRFLVQQSIKIGVYNYTDYTRFPINYCGITLSSQIV